MGVSTLDRIRSFLFDENILTIRTIEICWKFIFANIDLVIRLLERRRRDRVLLSEDHSCWEMIERQELMLFRTASEAFWKFHSFYFD